MKAGEEKRDKNQVNPLEKYLSAFLNHMLCHFKTTNVIAFY